MLIKRPTPLQRFWAKVHKTGTCWLWTGCTRNGYGQITVDRKVWSTHIWYWEQLNGPVPEGYELGHICHNRGCVRPDHVRPVTHRENMLESATNFTAINARKTHCPKGHEYTEANTYWYQGRLRRCRACDRLRPQRRYPKC